MARRQRGEGSVFQRGDGQWVGRVELGWLDGRRRRKTVYAPTQAKAVAKLRDARRAFDAGDSTTAGTTVEAWLRHWLDEIAPRQVKPRTIATYRSHAEQHVIPAIGRVRLDRLNIQHVHALHSAVTGKGLSSQTAMHAHRVLSTALNDAMRAGKATRNVAALARAPRVDSPEQEAMTLEQVHRVFAVIEDRPDASRWQFALTTGARQGECLGLQRDRLDLDARTADLAWQLQRIPYRHGCGDACGRRADKCPDRELDVRPGFQFRRLDGNLCLQRPKTRGSTRVVAMMAPLVDSLRLHLSRTDGGPHDLVWTRPDGRPVDGRDDYTEWQGILERAGLPPMTLHTARHTASTVMQALGVDEPTRMAALGHNLASTNKRYTHVSLETQHKAQALLAAALTT